MCERESVCLCACSFFLSFFLVFSPSLFLLCRSSFLLSCVFPISVFTLSFFFPSFLCFHVSVFTLSFLPSFLCFPRLCFYSVVPSFFLVFPRLCFYSVVPSFFLVFPPSLFLLCRSSFLLSCVSPSLFLLCPSFLLSCVSTSLFLLCRSFLLSCVSPVSVFHSVVLLLVRLLSCRLSLVMAAESKQMSFSANEDKFIPDSLSAFICLSLILKWWEE